MNRSGKRLLHRRWPLNPVDPLKSTRLVDTETGGVGIFPTGRGAMRISAKGEYAAKAVLHLSMEYPRVVTIHEVSHSRRIPLKYLEQILLALRKAGVLESRRGVHGGYMLARPPEEISVGEVLRAVDGRFSRTSCLEDAVEPFDSCPEANACGLRQMWRDVQVTVERILFQTSFAEVCRRTRVAQAKNDDLVAGLKLDG